jgi:predicted type IV restriction endonuclease
MSDSTDSLAISNPELNPPVSPKPVVSLVPKWEQAARARIQTALRKTNKPTLMLKSNDAVEADTRHLVTDILCDVLGFDKYENLTAEYSVKGDFADYGIRIDKQLMAFVEVKRISQKLQVSHLRQVESYALKEGVEWAILTNAQIWQAYHIKPMPGQQSEVTLIFEIDLLAEDIKIGTKSDLMFLISKEGISRGKITEYLSAKNALSAKTLVPIILSDEVLQSIRKEVKKKTKHNVDNKSLKEALLSLLPKQ